MSTLRNVYKWKKCGSHQSAARFRGPLSRDQHYRSGFL